MDKSLEFKILSQTHKRTTVEFDTATWIEVLKAMQSHEKVHNVNDLAPTKSGETFVVDVPPAYHVPLSTNLAAELIKKPKCQVCNDLGWYCGGCFTPVIPCVCSVKSKVAA